MPEKTKNLKKILIVEDEIPLSKALELKLGSSGFETAVAHDGLEALDLLKKEKYDLVILDLIMPKLDGFHVLEELKEKKFKTPILVTSNLGQEEDEKRALSLGAKAYFTKATVPLSELVNQIKKYI